MPFLKVVDTLRVPFLKVADTLRVPFLKVVGTLRVPFTLFYYKQHFIKSMETITLKYKRLPDRINYFKQQRLYEDENVIVTSQRITPSSPIIINGETVLGDNYTAVWFVFTGLWYDIGKIYNLNNEWTGYYCDIIKPVNRQVGTFEIVDLFLDVWVSPDNSFEIQDEDEFETAIRNGDISHELAEQARKALSELILTIEAGQFPPEFVENFTTPF